MNSGTQYIRGFLLNASTAALNNFEGMAPLLGSSFRVVSTSPSALYVYIIEFIILYVVKFC